MVTVTLGDKPLQIKNFRCDVSVSFSFPTEGKRNKQSRHTLVTRRIPMYKAVAHICDCDPQTLKTLHQ